MKIVSQFAAGEDIATIAFWFGKSVFQIEGVLREALKGGTVEVNGAREERGGDGGTGGTVNRHDKP